MTVHARMPHRTLEGRGGALAPAGRHGRGTSRGTHGGTSRGTYRGTSPETGRDAGAATAMSLDPLLLDLLACPVDKQALLYLPAEGILYNPRLRRSYAVRDGVPVLLADQGRAVTDERHAALLRRAADGGEPGGPVATLRVPLDDLIRDHAPGPRAVQDAASA